MDKGGMKRISRIEDILATEGESFALEKLREVKSMAKKGMI